MTDSESVDRPTWMHERLVERTIRHFQGKSGDHFNEKDAVQVLLSLSQLLEASGMLELENDDEKEVHRMGESEQS